ncbi:MAG TPA: F0F1 ATP synthase subunit epsilon [Gammaproteobacteria bacterium]|nr:F0F1 ATP synthase subunit epsilon [Gammaproteobacteria bacterium]
MTATMRLDIVSAEKEIFSQVVEATFITAEMGELGIYPGHAQLLSMLKPGNIRAILSDKSEEVFFINGGMLEVQPFAITVLSDTVIRARDIDEAAALEAKAAAERKLAEKGSEIDFAAATSELAEAIAQIRAIQQIRKRTK